MAQVIVTLSKVQVFENQDGSNVNLIFNEQINGYERHIGDNGVVDFVETQVSKVNMGLSALTAQLCAISDLINDYRSTRIQAFGQKEFALILRRGTILTLNREHHVAGEVYGTDENGVDLAYSRDCYTTELTDVKLTGESIKKLEKATEL